MKNEIIKAIKESKPTIYVDWDKSTDYHVYNELTVGQFVIFYDAVISLNTVIWYSQTWDSPEEGESTSEILEFDVVSLGLDDDGESGCLIVDEELVTLQEVEEIKKVLLNVIEIQ